MDVRASRVAYDALANRIEQSLSGRSPSQIEMALRGLLLSLAATASYDDGPHAARAISDVDLTLRFLASMTDVKDPS